MFDMQDRQQADPGLGRELFPVQLDSSCMYRS
jgi:hypothetical protein